MQSKDNIRLQHILEEAHEACKFIKGYSYEDFIKEGKTVRAIIRSVEVIGEAASKISKGFKDDHPEVPWNKIIGMRNHLIHVYFDIDYKTVWQTIQKDIPDLILVIKGLLNEHS